MALAIAVQLVAAGLVLLAKPEGPGGPEAGQDRLEEGWWRWWWSVTEVAERVRGICVRECGRLRLSLCSFV